MSGYVLILIDLQQEYTTPDRPFNLNGIASSLKNCQRLLACAREKRWSIWHVKHQQDREPFLAGSAFSEFIPGFEPQPEETVMIKHQLSAFTQPEFAALALSAHQSGKRLILAGYGGTMCCLSTAVEAMHRGIRLLWVADASLSRATAIANEIETHRHLTETMRIYADVTTTDALLDRLNSTVS